MPHLCSTCFNCNHGNVVGDPILVVVHNAFLYVRDFYKRSAKSNPPSAALNLYSSLCIEDTLHGEEYSSFAHGGVSGKDCTYQMVTSICPVCAPRILFFLQISKKGIPTSNMEKII